MKVSVELEKWVRHFQDWRPYGTLHVLMDDDGSIPGGREAAIAALLRSVRADEGVYRLGEDDNFVYELVSGELRLLTPEQVTEVFLRASQ